MLLSALPLTQAASAHDPVEEQRRDMVILLHGLGRTSVSMKRVEWRLRQDGFRVVNITYPSRRRSVEELADRWLPEVIAVNVSTPTARVHFVSHSLGGIVLRQYLAKHSLTNLGRVVMLAPPNQGSELADRLSGSVLGRWLLGPSLSELGTADAGLPKRLGPAQFEVGIITGDRSFNPFLSRLLPGPNDGKVSVASARLEGMKDFLIVHSSHTWVMWRRKTVDQVSHFLAHGHFEQK